MLRGGIIALYEGERVTDQMYRRRRLRRGHAGALHRAGERGAGRRPICRARKANGVWPKPRPHYATIEASDVVAEELALERIQSARALVEAVDALLTGGR